MTAQSDLYTGFAELSLRVGQASTPLPSTRALDQGRYPILSSTSGVGQVLYTQTTFAAPVGSSQVNFVRVAAFNPTDRPRDAQITAFVRNAGAPLTGDDAGVCRSYRFRRPEIPPRTGLYSQPGLEFSPFSTYAFSGRGSSATPTVIYDFPRPPAPLRLTPSMRVDARPIDSRTIVGQTEYAGRLAPHQRVVLDFRMPVEPVPPAGAAYRAITHASFSAYRRKTRASWARFLGAAMRLDLPEPKVVDTFYASLVNILMPRYRVGGRRLGPGGQRAVLPRLLAARRLRHDPRARRESASAPRPSENLAVLPDVAAPRTGLFISRPGQLDGFGQALWAFGDHFRRTGDAGFAQRLSTPPSSAPMAWFDGASAPRIRSSLMPPARPARQRVHRAATWPATTSGPTPASTLAVDMARGSGARRAADRCGRRPRRLRGACSRPRSRGRRRPRGGAIPPALDAGGGQDWGNFWAPYPLGLSRPRDPLGGRARSRTPAASSARASPPTLDTRCCTHYLGFRVFETELLRGEQRRRSSAACTTSSRTRRRHDAGVRGRHRAVRRPDRGRRRRSRTAGSPPSTSRCCATCSCASRATTCA